MYGRFKASARNAVGAPSNALRQYFERYQREFRKVHCHLSQTELLSSLATADIFVCGDYHTLAQAQRTALELADGLRQRLEASQPLIIALEMLPARFTPIAEDYLAGRLSEEEFLARIGYWKNWGFAWKNYRVLFEFARAHGLRVVGLNLAAGKNTGTLAKRDEHAAKVIADLRQSEPNAKIFVLFGDLHLASAHLPRSIERRLAAKGMKARIAVVHQNIEAVYWKLAKKGQVGEQSIVRLASGKFCILSVPPWVKLQSYLEWMEVSRPDYSRFQERGRIAVEDWNDIIVELRQTLCEFLELKPAKVPGFSLQSSQSPHSIAPLRLHFRKNRRQWTLVSHALRELPSIYLAEGPWLCARKPTHTQLAALAAGLLHSELTVGYPQLRAPRKDFYRWVWAEAISFLGSKIINPNRRCWGMDDYRFYSSQTTSAATWVKMVGSYFDFEEAILKNPRLRWGRVPNLLGSISTRAGRTEFQWLCVARAVGRVLGNAIYCGYVDGSLTRKDLLKLFRQPLSSPQKAAERYCEWVRKLDALDLRSFSRNFARASGVASGAKQSLRRRAA